MTDGPTSRDEALALVAAIVVRVARRIAEHDAAQVSTARPAPHMTVETRTEKS